MEPNQITQYILDLIGKASLATGVIAAFDLIEADPIPYFIASALLVLISGFISAFRN